MVPDVPPREASDRLIIFQNRFDTLYRKYQTYSGGEVLFGLPVTEHPELLQVNAMGSDICLRKWAKFKFIII